MASTTRFYREQYDAGTDAWPRCCDKGHADAESAAGHWQSGRRTAECRIKRVDTVVTVHESVEDVEH